VQRWTHRIAAVLQELKFGRERKGHATMKSNWLMKILVLFGCAAFPAAVARNASAQDAPSDKPAHQGREIIL
jgi:hypothetical protein